MSSNCPIEWPPYVNSTRLGCILLNLIDHAWYNITMRWWRPRSGSLSQWGREDDARRGHRIVLRRFALTCARALNAYTILCDVDGSDYIEQTRLSMFICCGMLIISWGIELHRMLFRFQSRRIRILFLHYDKYYNETSQYLTQYSTKYVFKMCV